jgi:hypothetical protein
MRVCWLVWLGFAAPLAAEPVRLDPLPLHLVVAIPPSNPDLPELRPNEFPNLDPRDLPSMVRPPAKNQPPVFERRHGPRSDYDPALQYLPDRNPGERQPPCPCLPLGSTWIDATYFIGKTKDDRLPALVSVGGSGIDGVTGASVLYGNERLDRPFRSGIRADIGHWFDRCQNWGIDASFFYMESSQIGLETASNGSPLLARPFIAEPGTVPSALPLAVAGTTRGSLFVTSPLTFFGADVNSRHTLFCEDRVRLDFLGGYRFIRMKESLTIHSRTEGTATALLGLSQDLEDTFAAVNLFNGGQVGIAGEYRWERIYIAGTGKAAIGINWYRLDIDGSTRTQAAGTTSTAAGGFLARSSNSGRTGDTRFAVVPEANLTVGYQLADHWRTFLGYTFVYVSRVARPGPAIDLQMGTTTAGATHPLRLDPNSDFWMHGINLGVEARY